MNYTSHHQNLQKNLMLPQEHLEDGQKKENLDVLDQTQVKEEEKESITSKMSKKYLESKTNDLQMIQSQYVTQELVPVTKKKILKDNVNYLEKNIQMQKPLKILGPVSIGNDQDLIPFWNKSTLEMSKQLWLPLKTDCVDLDSNLLSGYSKKLMLNSWFSVQTLIPKTCLKNSQMTYLQSLQSLLPKIMALEQDNLEDKEKNLKEKKAKKKKVKIETQEEKDLRETKMNNYLQKNKEKEEKKILKGGKAEKSIKIRIYPDKEQKKIINRWFGVRRWVYNQCLNKVKQIGTKISIKELRETVINNINFEKENIWMKDYEYDLRDEALRDLVKNVSSNIAKGGLFNMKFKSKKEENRKVDSISVLAKKWNKPNNFYSKVFKPSVLKSSEKLLDDLKYDSRLLKTPTKKYYLCIPKPLGVIKSENQALNNMIFLDPGVKNFITGYDPSGKIITWGKRDIGRIARLLHYKRKLQSKTEKALRHSKRYKYRIAGLRIGEKIKNLVDELHKKLAKWLCENYNYIYLPKLNFHNCKNLNKKSKAKLASFRHCSFFDRLMYKTREYSNCKVLEVNESFTSKTCSNCGFQKENLKNKDIYKCKNCKIVIERDINASKNIMLRYFTKRAVVTQQRNINILHYFSKIR